jgi:hypothetical protein
VPTSSPVTLFSCTYICRIRRCAFARMRKTPGFYIKLISFKAYELLGTNIVESKTSKISQNSPVFS